MILLTLGGREISVGVTPLVQLQSQTSDAWKPTALQSSMPSLVYSFRSSLVAEIVLVAALVTGAAAAPSPLTPELGANHYILVVDASFSTVSSPSRVTAYQRVLRERLTEAIFSGRLGNIPPALPERDVFTILMFGIVGEERSANEAYAYLHDYSFRRHFIHPVVVRERMTARNLNAVLWPRAFYRLTVLQWAKRLALASLPPARPTDSSNRTFLIVANDGMPNEGIPSGEEDMVKRWGDATDFAATQTLLAQNAASYRLTEEATLQLGESVNGSLHRFFIEGHEVIPTAVDALQKQLDAVRPLERFDFGYDIKQGRPTWLWISASLSPGFLSWIGKHGGTKEPQLWRIDGNDSKPVAASQSLSWPVPPVSDPCSTIPLVAIVEGVIHHIDPLLGTSRLAYRLPQPFIAPSSPACTAGQRRRLMIAAIIAFLLLAIYYALDRLFISRPRVTVPGLNTSVALLGRERATPLVRPRPGVEAFSIHLPPLWKQRLFCVGMTITLSGDGVGKIEWPGGDGSLRLPYAGNIHALWRSAPDDAAEVVIHLKEMGWSSAVRIEFPKG